MFGLSPNQSKLVASTLVLIAVAGLLVFFAIQPVLRGLASAQEEITKSQTDLVVVSEKINSYKAAAADLSKVKNVKDQLFAVFPDRESMVNLVQALESSATSTSIDMKLKLTDEEDNPAIAKNVQKPPLLVPDLRNVQEVAYSISFTGEYRQLVDFLLLAEHLPYITEFSGIAMQAITSDSGSYSQTSQLVNQGIATVEIQGVFFIRSANK